MMNISAVVIKIRNKIIQAIYNILVFGRFNEPTQTFDRGDIHKILVVRKDNVGDLICTTPVFANLRRNFPNAYIAAFVCSYTAPVIEGNPDINKIFIYEKHKHTKKQARLRSWLNMYRTIKSIQKEGFDLAFGMMSGFSSSLGWLVFVTRAKFRVGYVNDQTNIFNFFYNLPVLRENGIVQHEVESNLELLNKLDLDTKERKLYVIIPKVNQVVEDVIRLMDNKPNRPRINLHLSKRRQPWPAERFIDLGNELINLFKAGLILTWAPGDIEVKEKVEKGLIASPLVYPTRDFKELGATILASNLFITAEGGPMHFSMALGIPTIGIFGRTSPHAWHPWGEHGYYLYKDGDILNVQVEDVMEKVKLVFLKSS
ncbi:MAG: glycosyltransferase family 9 protein [bacterium]